MPEQKWEEEFKKWYNAYFDYPPKHYDSTQFAIQVFITKNRLELVEEILEMIPDKFESMDIWDASEEMMNVKQLIRDKYAI